MDISFWTQCNPDCRIEHTAKKFYNRYFYKLTLDAPGSRAVTGDDSIEHSLQMLAARHYNYAGSWGANRRAALKRADADFLETLRDIKHDPKIQVKIRIEDPHVQIYANTEDQLKTVVAEFQQRALKYIIAISAPESAEIMTILDSGAILRRRASEYRYKIVLKDGRYPDDTREALRNYLDQLGTDLVKLPKSVREGLENVNHGFLWNAYFYSNDAGIINFLNLIAPGMIGNIHELVVAPDK